MTRARLVLTLITVAFGVIILSLGFTNVIDNTTFLVVFWVGMMILLITGYLLRHYGYDQEVPSE